MGDIGHDVGSEVGFEKGIRVTLIVLISRLGRSSPLRRMSWQSGFPAVETADATPSEETPSNV
jgi:hypothetical protein